MKFDLSKTYTVNGTMLGMILNAETKEELQDYIETIIKYTQELEIQTRSETNGLQFFKTFKDAFNHAKIDKTVWKISTFINGEHIRLVKNSENGWEYEPIMDSD